MLFYNKNFLQILTIQRATQANLASLTFEDSEIKINPGKNDVLQSKNDVLQSKYDVLQSKNDVLH
jgi:hypothetical protein